jgi:hypothetical protein
MRANEPGSISVGRVKKGLDYEVRYVIHRVQFGRPLLEI